VTDATVIYVAAGQQVLDANVQLTAASPTRTLRIALDWNGHDRALYNKPPFFR